MSSKISHCNCNILNTLLEVIGQQKCLYNNCQFYEIKREQKKRLAFILLVTLIKQFINLPQATYISQYLMLLLLIIAEVPKYVQGICTNIVFRLPLKSNELFHFFICIRCEKESFLLSLKRYFN
jgi:hypothetical protein